MQLIIAGVHQRTAPVAVRERLAFGPEELCGALQALRQHTDEGFIISTCNRVEVCGFFSDDQASDEVLTQFLAEWHFLPVNEFAPHLYTYRDSDAIHHIFRLAAGLDSMVLGEDQIMGQLKDALASAHNAGSIGNVLHRLLQNALATGKLVRTHTGIAHHRRSVVSVALDQARQVLGDLDGQRVLVIGAGQIAELSLKHLRAHNLQSLGIINRTFARAERLAASYGAYAWAPHQLEEALQQADVVIACTASPTTVIDKAMVQRLMAQRQTPLLLLDLAVPRDVDRAVREVPNAYVFDIDDMQSVAISHQAARAVDAAQAEHVVALEVERFSSWLETQRVIPTIRALRKRAETIRQAEIERTLARCPELSERERAAIETLTESIINKLLHHPITQLKESQGGELAPIVQQLFELTESVPNA